MDRSPLAKLAVLTDRRQAESRGRSLVETIVATVDGGAKTVLLREKDLPAEQRIGLVAIFSAILREAEGQLLVASDVELAIRGGGHGVHLASDDAWPDRSSLPDGFLLGRSCHNRADVGEAVEQGADYVTLSPIFESPSKPGYGPPLGVEALHRLPIATLALGGVRPNEVSECMLAGAAGVAAMGEIMRADDPAATVGFYLEALAEAEEAAKHARVRDNREGGA